MFCYIRIYHHICIHACTNTSKKTTPLLTHTQDFFNTGLIPADTDYKMFADPQAASIPGIDVAYVLGGAVYHTSRDAVDNLRPGTLQVCLITKGLPRECCAWHTFNFIQHAPNARVSHASSYPPLPCIGVG